MTESRATIKEMSDWASTYLESLDELDVIRDLIGAICAGNGDHLSTVLLPSSHIRRVYRYSGSGNLSKKGGGEIEAWGTRVNEKV